MKQVTIVRTGSPEQGLVLQEAATPVPLEGDVLVRVTAAGVNFADVVARKGLYPGAPRLPYVPGYEVAGHVEALGSGVSDLRVGDPVLAMILKGGYAEFVRAPRRQVYLLPPDADLAVAAALPVQALTAWYALFETGTVRPGDRVLIHAAAGGVGLMAVQMARHVGAEIFGTCGSDAKCAFLKQQGVAHPINYRRFDYVSEVRRLAGGGGVDLVLDSLGGREIGRGLGLLRAGGRVASFGYAAQTANVVSMIVGFLTMKSLQTAMMLRDSYGFHGINMLRLVEYPERVLPRMNAVLELWRSGVLEPHIGARFPLENAALAHTALEGRGTMGKVLLTMGGASA